MADLQRKTDNLFSSEWVQGGISPTDGHDFDSNISIRTNDYIAITPNVIYSMSRSIAISIVKMRFYDSGKNYIGAGSSETIAIISGSIEVNPMRENEYFCCFKIIKNTVAFMRIVDDSGNTNTKYMFVEGEFTSQTMPPYEPYWQHSLRKLTTATEAVENPLYSDGTAITSYTIKGNTVQNGTPTPSNPVDVNGVGVRTENLFDSNINVISGYLSAGGILKPASEDTSQITFDYIPIIPGTYTFTYTVPSDSELWFGVCTYDKSRTFQSRLVSEYSGAATFTIPDTTKYIRISLRGYNKTPIIMLNEGSTALPYEPWGIKIPISNGQQTTNIYLGSTQTVRQVKKLVLDGTESNWLEFNNLILYRLTDTSPDYRTQVGGAICDSLPLVARGDLTTNTFCWSSGTIGELIININNYNLADLKTYLSSNPITIWYVLATPETGIVNEPLMKIGDYADTLSNATAIPATEGANSITVDTTVQPSEFTATWTGWHDASVKEWDGSEWQ